MWSTKHKQCFKCGTQSVPHAGYGFCKECYSKWKAIENRDIFNETKARYKKRNHLIYQLKENKRSRINKSPNSLRQTNVHKGMFAEKEAVKILSGSVRINRRFHKQSPYDIEWNGKKIDVKSANKSHYKFSFNLAGSQNRSDYIFCMGYINNKIHKLWLIPSAVFPQEKNSIAFGCKSSKFDKYIFHQNVPPSIPASIEANSTDIS